VLRKATHVFVDTVSESNELGLVHSWHSTGGVEPATEYQGAISTSVFMKPGEIKRFVFTLDSTYFEPGTSGFVGLLNVSWRTSDRLGRFDGNISSPVEGNIVSFEETLMPVCEEVENKIKDLKLPMSGWKCGNDPKEVNLLIFAREDEAKCFVRFDEADYMPITAGQILSKQQIQFFDNSGIPSFKCVHN
jgi:hypothetical protein